MCHGEFGGKSCAKIVPVNIYHYNYLDKCLKTFAILDEQRNKYLVKENLLGMFSTELHRWSFLPSLSVKRSLNQDEIPKREVANCLPHLQCMAGELPPLECRSEIMLLIYRDLVDGHHVLEQIPANRMYMQRLRLGWVIVGETCRGGTHKPDIHALKSPVAVADRYLSHVKARYAFGITSHGSFPCRGRCLFGLRTNKEDDTPGMPIEERSFIVLLDDQCYQGLDGKWITPLSFKTDRHKLANNRSQVLYRARNLDSTLSEDPAKRNISVHSCRNFSIAIMQR
jgi:hypothetical protein